ncbi:MAG TPA: hypothetical protein ENI61_06555 [Ignavibacteria bacterium]|nr:hypothetical protein [Ignavibacteria bacterium]
MSSLIMILWCSIASIGIIIDGNKNNTIYIIQIMFQILCLIAASIQVGYIESGTDSIYRKPFQIIVMIGFIIILILSSSLIKI